MQRLIGLLFFPLTALWALDVSMLTPEKQAVLAQKAAAIEAGERRLKYDWVGEVSLSASATESKGAGSNESTLSQQAGASFAQDLFRSGGITASIRYADEWARAERLALEQTTNGYLQELALARLGYEQDRIRLEQNDRRLENSEIALFLKRRQYEAGEADITQLNDALRERNTLQKARVELQAALRNRRLELGRLTPLEPEAIALPVYAPLTQETFTDRHLASRLAQAQSRMAKTQQAISAAGYLPALSATASVDYRQSEGLSADGESYSAGLRLSMPLSLTATAAVQEKKAEALRTRSLAQDAKLAAAALYDQTAATIAALEEGRALLGKNIALYDELIAVTDRAVRSGERSRYDLQTLQNTRAIDNDEIRLSDLAIRIEQAKLHYALTWTKASHE
ncbi:MAG: TolC family protein [Campylobacterales bacterium]